MNVRECSFFILLQVVVQFPASLIKDCLFSILYCYLLCHKLIDHSLVNLFLGFLFCSLIYSSTFAPVPHCFDYCSFVVQSEVREHNSSRSVLISRLAIWGVLYFHTHFKNICSSFAKKKKMLLVFYKDCIESADCLVQYGHLNNIDFPNKNMIYITICLLSSVSFISVQQSLEYRSFASLCRFIPRYLIVFDVMTNRIVLLIFLSDFQLLMYRNATNF